MADWRVREASADDADRLALVGAATFLETFAGVLDGAAIVQHCAAEHAPAAYRRYLAQPRAAAWLLETREGAAPVGYALLARPDLPGVPPDGDDLELKRIYVFSRFHGSGAAAALLEPVLARAEAGGAARLLLGVYAGNGRAIAFYRKSGFEPVGRRRFTVGDRAYDDVVLARPLTAAAPRQQPEPAWT